MSVRPRLGALSLAAGLAAGLTPALAQTGGAGPAPATEVDTLAAPGATAVDAYALDSNPIPPTGVGARFTIGAGASYSPDYFGAEDYSFGPSGTLRFDYIRLPGGFEFGSTGAVGFVEGFGARGTARYIGSRKASDNSELRGLENVDAALELGLGVGYEAAYWRAFADVSYGVIGHHAWVGEFGADAILRPNDAWIVNFGPRAYWGAERFIDTYFGVSGSEEDASAFRKYDPSAGFYSAGVELGARYSFSPSWGVEGAATYERLINDAGDSPITDVGSQNQFGLQVLITRSLSLGF